jgi:hypothetical protein
MLLYVAFIIFKANLIISLLRIYKYMYKIKSDKIMTNIFQLFHWFQNICL